MGRLDRFDGFWDPEQLRAAELSSEDRSRAMAFVASHALDVEDCQSLLDALGLLPVELADPPRTRKCVHCGARHDRYGTGRRDRFCSERCFTASADRRLASSPTTGLTG